MFAAQARCLPHFIHRTILSFLKEADQFCLFQKIQLACAPPSATIAGTKPGRQGKPICVPNELCSNTSMPSHAFWLWHLLLPGLLFGPDPLRLRLPSFQCFLPRLPLCFPEPHALPLIIPGNEPSFPVQRGLQKSDGHPHQAGERQFFAHMRTTAEPLLRCQLLLPTAIEAG